MDRFALMEVFTRVVETGSFTKAAEELGVSRATVSVSVQQLEGLLRVPLLHRTTRSVKLTREGRVLHERALRLLSTVADTERLFHGPKREARELTIDVPTRLARRVLLPALPELLGRHPELAVHLRAASRALPSFKDGVDAALRVGHVRAPKHVVRPLGVFPRVSCASPSYLARHGAPATLDDLEHHVVVGHTANAGGAVTWSSVFGDAVHARPMRRVVTVDDAETYIAAGLSGLGIIQVPAHDVRHHLEAGALVPILPEHAPPPLPVALVHPRRKDASSRLAPLVSWLEPLLGRHGLRP